MFHFKTPWKCKKTRGSLTFSGSIETEHWLEIGSELVNNMIFNANYMKRQEGNFGKNLLKCQEHTSKYVFTLREYTIRGVSRTLANILDGEFCNNSCRLKAIKCFILDACLSLEYSSDYPNLRLYSRAGRLIAAKILKRRAISSWFNQVFISR